MKRSHDYRALERENVTGQISLRELCRKHGIHDEALDAIDLALDKFRDDVRATEVGVHTCPMPFGQPARS